jgi:hypothetical protein
MSNDKVLSLAAYKCDEVDRKTLEGVVLPPATKTYQPIAHSWLLDMLQDAVEAVGMRFGHEHHGLSHDGMRYFGLIELLGVGKNAAYRTMMGLRNSLDKRFRAQAAFGNQIMVCANLCFWGNYEFGRKHTTHIERDLPELIRATLMQVPEMSMIQDKRFEAYKEQSLSVRNADHLIMNMLRVGAVNTARIEKVIKEWDNPSYDHGDRTVWRAHNAATQALKGVNIHEMPKRTILLQEVCDQACGFKPPITK